MTDCHLRVAWVSDVGTSCAIAHPVASCLYSHQLSGTEPSLAEARKPEHSHP
ncbi:hypothetical protein [Marinobacter sp.]|uniref:hypothetical protein n=1 Tax=Marinobacter sp. TaxID=50741 RepID=UPI003851588C